MRGCVVNQNKHDATGDLVLLHDQCETSLKTLWLCSNSSQQRECEYLLVFWSEFHWIEVQVLEGNWFLTLNVGYFANQNLSSMEK